MKASNTSHTIAPGADQGPAATSLASTSVLPAKRKHDIPKAADDDLEDLPSTLHPDDPSNFLLLCSALKVWIQRTVTDSDITEGENLMEDYLKQLLTVCCLCMDASYAIY